MMINSPRQSSPHGRAYLFLVLTALFLAMNHVIGRAVHGDLPPIGLSFWRWFVGGLILLPFVLTRGHIYRRVLQPNIKTFSLLGSLVVGSTTLVFIALNSTTAINVSVINVIQPCLTVIFAWLFLRETLSLKQIVGVGVAAAGVLFMVSRGDWQLLVELDLNRGDIITLVAMCGFSAYAINVRKIPTNLNFVDALFGIIVMGCLALLPFYLIESFVYAPLPLNLQTVIAVMALAILVSVLAMLMWNYGNRAVGPSRAGVFINLIPVFGIVLATTFLGESVYLYHLVGGGCILVGIWLVIKTPKKAKG